VVGRARRLVVSVAPVLSLAGGGAAAVGSAAGCGGGGVAALLAVVAVLVAVLVTWVGGVASRVRSVVVVSLVERPG
jgi:hypothetical protein